MLTNDHNMKWYFRRLIQSSTLWPTAMNQQRTTLKIQKAHCFGDDSWIVFGGRLGSKCKFVVRGGCDSLTIFYPIRFGFKEKTVFTVSGELTSQLLGMNQILNSWLCSISNYSHPTMVMIRCSSSIRAAATSGRWCTWSKMEWDIFARTQYCRSQSHPQSIWTPPQYLPFWWS